MTRVLVIDDHPIVLQGCRRLLAEIGLGDVASATSVGAGYRQALRDKPDAIVTDLTFAGDDLAGLSLIERIVAKDPEARIMVFSMHDDPAIVSRALTGGALAYVLKDAPSGEFALAFGKLMRGEPHLGHDLAVRVAMLRARGAQGPGSKLTEREAEILRLLGQGHGYDRIATKLGISSKTVTNATSLMRAKLKLGSLADLIRFAHRDGNRGLV